MMRFVLVICTFGWLAPSILAQEAALENNFAINYSINSWKLNTSLGHRSVREKIGESTSTELAFLEINQFITKKISPKLSISFGYKYRDINNIIDEIEHRITQQVALVHHKEHFRFVSRLRLEQRFRNQFIHRYRYRFSMDVPLNGVKLDSKEFYMVVSNEIILQKVKTGGRFDNRLSIGVGYVFSQVSKLQLDFTHRMEDLNDEIEHIPFVTTSLLFNIN